MKLKRDTEKKKFLITIDTEGDNLWRPMYSRNSINRITNKNGKYIERFQQICEKYGFKPTYLVDYEMCESQPFVELGKHGLKRGTLEIGMHMHAWNCPPYYYLKPGKSKNCGNPYIGEYPLKIIEKKVNYLTHKLQDTFETDIISHRSGRWYLDKEYIGILKKYGYRVDCSVTPGVNWRNTIGLTKGSKGTNYNNYPSESYEVNLKKINRSGKSGFYEIPVTVESERSSLFKIEHKWLRPNKFNLEDMINIINVRYHQGYNYVEFMLHSSELMPYGSSTFESKADIERLYYDLETLFQCASEMYEGNTLKEYYTIIKETV